MTKIIIAYSRKPRQGFDNSDPNGTSHVEYDYNEIFTPSQDLKCIVFNVVETEYARTFIEQWKNTTSRNGNRKIQFNEYEQISKEMLVKSQKEMLATINSINVLWPEYTVPERITIEVNENDAQVDKLNALHEYFEDTSNFNNALEQRNMELYYLLEKVNYLVHKMEGGARTEVQSRHTVVRTSGVYQTAEDFYKLTDVDYADFEATRPGMLYIDFATVGKDFWACYYTKDAELIRNQKVSPQEYIRPCMSFGVSTEPMLSNSEYKALPEKLKQRANKWLQENQLSTYIDIDEPKHAYGRLRLGKMERNITYDELNEMSLSHPYVYGVYIA